MDAEFYSIVRLLSAHCILNRVKDNRQSFVGKEPYLLLASRIQEPLPVLVEFKKVRDCLLGDIIRHREVADPLYAGGFTELEVFVVSELLVAGIW